jgi:homoserine kinase
MAESAELLARLRADGHPAVVSGAGPSVLAFGVAGAPVIRAAEYARSGNPEAGGRAWRVSELSIAAVGVAVDEVGPTGEPATRGSWVQTTRE